MAHLIQSHIAPLSNDPTQDAMSQPSDGSSDVTHVAQILTIDVSRLQEGDKAEAAKLFKASKEDGVFYLDFSDQKCMKMIEAAGNVFDLMKELFHLSDEEKMKYDIDLLGRLKLNGYKPVGRNFGGINGKSDGFESYTIPGKSHFAPPFVRPPFLTNALPHLLSFCAEANNVLSLVLSSLSDSLNLSGGTSLCDLHRVDSPSPDIVRLLHYLRQPASETGDPQTPHTDLGSLTLLFTGSPGLQVLAPQSKKWAFVMSKPNCAVVNIGDGLSMLTGGLLHSCLHRVRPLPGRTMEERYSFAYLQRAEDDVKMETLPGIDNHATDKKNGFTSREWLESKFGMLRAKTCKEGMERQKILTGRADVLPQ